jgi:hypothetical protein
VYACVSTDGTEQASCWDSVSLGQDGLYLLWPMWWCKWTFVRKLDVVRGKTVCQAEWPTPSISEVCGMDQNQHQIKAKIWEPNKKWRAGKWVQCKCDLRRLKPGVRRSLRVGWWLVAFFGVLWRLGHRVTLSFLPCFVPEDPPFEQCAAFWWMDYFSPNHVVD